MNFNARLIFRFIIGLVFVVFIVLLILYYNANWKNVDDIYHTLLTSGANQNEHFAVVNGFRRYLQDVYPLHLSNWEKSSRFNISIRGKKYENIMNQYVSEEPTVKSELASIQRKIDIGFSENSVPPFFLSYFPFMTTRGILLLIGLGCLICISIPVFLHKRKFYSMYIFTAVLLMFEILITVSPNLLASGFDTYMKMNYIIGILAHLFLLFSFFSLFSKWTPSTRWTYTYKPIVVLSFFCIASVSLSILFEAPVFHFFTLIFGLLIGAWIINIILTALFGRHQNKRVINHVDSMKDGPEKEWTFG